MLPSNSRAVRLVPHEGLIERQTSPPSESDDRAYHPWTQFRVGTVIFPSNSRAKLMLLIPRSIGVFLSLPYASLGCEYISWVFSFARIAILSCAAYFPSNSVIKLLNRSGLWVSSNAMIQGLVSALPCLVW